MFKKRSVQDEHILPTLNVIVNVYILQILFPSKLQFLKVQILLFEGMSDIW